MTSVDGGPLRAPRGRAAVGWSEFSTRYLLLEGILKDRRVLEIGTFDPRSLLRLHDLGAGRVIGCTEDASRFDRSRFPSRSIELFGMDPGRIDFADGSFDVVLVVDLAKELSHNPRFVFEVRRVLAKDGFCLLAYPSSGRALVDLVEDGPLPALSPSRLEDAVREVFTGARFYLQAPFVGVAIEPEGRRAEGVSLEPSTDTTPSRPSHVLAFAGRGLPELQDRTLVELPFLDFEAMAEAERARTTADHQRLMLALAEAKQQLKKREDSLRQIHERLPKLRSAFEAKLRALSSRPPLRPEVVTPTVLERPTDEVRRAPIDLVRPLEERLQKEQERRQAAEARILELEAEADLLERQLRANLPEPSVREEQGDWASGEPAGPTEVPFAATIIEKAPDRGELIELWDRIRDKDLALAEAAQALSQSAREVEALKARLRDYESESARTVPPSAAPLELEEAERKIHLLERTASAQELRIEELTQELESHKEVRHALGSDVKDAEARLLFLSRRVDEERLERAELERRTEARIETLTAALNRVDQEKEALRDRLTQAEEEQAEAVARAIAEVGQRVRRDRDQEQANLESLRDRLYAAERELFEKRTVAESLEQRLVEKEARLVQLSQSAGNVEADKKALELAAAHLSREAETLRARVAELRQERDTLAATSQLLLAERDTAAALARRALEAEELARVARQEAQDAEGTIERLERELDEAEAARSALEDRLIQAAEDAKRHFGEGAGLRAQLEPKERELKEWQAKVAAFDGRLAEMQRALSERERERDRALSARAELEAMVREVSSTAGLALREVQLVSAERDARDRRAKEALTELGEVLASRAAAEAKAVEATGQALLAQGERALLVAERAQLLADRQHLERKLSQALAEMVGLEDELSRLLEQAPTVSKEELLGLQAALQESITRREGAEEALTRTLAEAARVSTQLLDRERENQSLAQQLERGERERLEIERARRQAEEGRRSAEAALAHAVAESRAAGEKVTRLSFELQAAEQAVLHGARAQAALKVALEAERKARDEALAAAPDPALKAEMLERMAELEELRLGLGLAKEVAEAQKRELLQARAERTTLQQELELLRQGQAEAVALAQRLEVERDEAADAQRRVQVNLQNELQRERAAKEDAELQLAGARVRVEGLEQALAQAYEVHNAAQAAERHAADALRTTLLAERIAREEAEQSLEVARSRLGELQGELRVLKAVEALGRASDPPLGKDPEVERLRARLIELEAALASTAPSPAADGFQAPWPERDDELVIAEARAEAARLEAHRWKKERDQLRRQLEAMEANLAAERGQLQDRQAAAGELDAQLHRQEEQITALEEEITGLRRSALEHQEALAEQRHHRAISEARITKLEDELQLAQQTLRIEQLRAEGAENAGRELEATLGQAETRSAALGGELQHQERQNEALADQLRQAQDQLRDARQQLELLEQRLQNEDSAAGALELKLQDAEAKANLLESEVEALRAELVQRERALHELERARRQAQSERTAALESTADLRQNLEALREETQRQTQDLSELAAQRAQVGGELEALLARIAGLEAENQRLGDELAEARASAPPKEELRRLLSRAGELEVRAEKAEKERDRLLGEVTQKGLREAQALERATRAEERATQKEERLKKEETKAIEAEERARHAEILAREVDGRARDLENKRRTLEARALAAEGKAEHAERLVKQAEAQVKQLDARLRSLGEESHKQRESAEQRAQEAERMLVRTRSESNARLGELEGKLTTLEEVAAAREAQRAELERTRSELDQLRSRLQGVEAGGATTEDTMALRARCRSLEQMISQRDGELKRLTALSEKVARELDEARADVGRKLAEIRQNREGLDFVRRQLTQARSEAEALRAKLEQSGDAAELKAQLESKDQELARIRAEGLSAESERHRLRSLIQASEQAQVQHERRIAELEAGLVERNQRLELLRRELADKTERLRRLSGLNE